MPRSRTLPPLHPARLTPVIAALALLSAHAARAQSLEALFETARGYDATYLSVRSLAESAQYRAAQADALRRPSAQLNANGTYTQATLPSPYGSTDSKDYGASVSASYPLYSRSASPTIQQARKSLEATQADLASAEQDLIIRVAQAYFDVLGAQDTLSTTRGNKAAITEQLASAKRNFEVGTATITDTREAQARYDLAVAQEIAAENDLTTKKIALDQLVGKTGVSPHPLAVPVTLPGVMPADAQAWVDIADQVQPSVHKARLALEIAQLDTAIAKAAEAPTVNLVGSYGVDHSIGSVTTTVPGLTRSGSIGVQLTMPLYTGGSAQNRVRETTVLEEKSRQDLEAARRSVALATRQAYYSLQSGVAQVKALEAAEGSSKLALEATQLGYKVGVRVNLDVLNAQSQLYQTESDLAKARYNVILGDLRLRQASGQLKPDDVRAVNALLAP